MYANPRVALSRTYGDWTAEAALDHRRVVQNQNVPPCGVSGAFLEQRASEQSDHKLNPQRFSKKNAIGGHPRFGVAEWGCEQVMANYRGIHSSTPTSTFINSRYNDISAGPLGVSRPLTPGTMVRLAATMRSRCPWLRFAAVAARARPPPAARAVA